MRIFAVETSGKASSVALLEDGRLSCEIFQNRGLTHSKTLAPMAEELLASCGLVAGDMDGYAVSAGPGSFTGIRIGVSFVKAMAWSAGRPVAAVSSLAACAWNAAGWEDHLICPAFDARAGQVYAGLFQWSGGRMTRLRPDAALRTGDLFQWLENTGKNCIFLGDGAKLCYNTLLEAGLPAELMPEESGWVRASGVAREGLFMLESGMGVHARDAAPVYLKKPQAERERLKRLEEGI